MEHTVTAQPDAISEDEIALYDRQIRLWGMHAQERIRSAHVLLVTMRGLGNEVAKNLVLAGVGALTIVDHEAATDADLDTQFLLAAPQAAQVMPENAYMSARRAAARSASSYLAGKYRADATIPQLHVMNPRVRLSVDHCNIRTRAPDFFAPFTIVVATDLDPSVLTHVNAATRQLGLPFYAASTYGFFGYIFADLIEHDFTIVREQGNVRTVVGTQESRTRRVVGVELQPADDAGPEKEVVTKRELYSPWYPAAETAPLPRSINLSVRRRRLVTPFLPCIRALWAFQRKHASENYRMPLLVRPEESAEFQSLVTEQQKALCLPEVPFDRLWAFMNSLGGHEISPVVTVVGGQLAQDIINTLGGTQQPIQNLLIFDGTATQSLEYSMHPEGELGKQTSSSSSSQPQAAAGTVAGAATEVDAGAA